MEISLAISLIALLVAILSGIYARWSWSESRKSNEISQTPQRREIYDAFFELRNHMAQKADIAELGEVVKFYYHSRNARFFFPSELALKVESYYMVCFDVARIHQRVGGTTSESMEECTPLIENGKQLSNQIEEEMVSYIKSSYA